LARLAQRRLELVHSALERLELGAELRGAIVELALALAGGRRAAGGALTPDQRGNGGELAEARPDGRDRLAAVIARTPARAEVVSLEDPAVSRRHKAPAGAEAPGAFDLALARASKAAPSPAELRIGMVIVVAGARGAAALDRGDDGGEASALAERRRRRAEEPCEVGIPELAIR